jgi:hypothetical protein
MRSVLTFGLGLVLMFGVSAGRADGQSPARSAMPATAPVTYADELSGPPPPPPTRLVPGAAYGPTGPQTWTGNSCGTATASGCASAAGCTAAAGCLPAGGCDYVAEGGMCGSDCGSACGDRQACGRRGGCGNRCCCGSIYVIGEATFLRLNGPRDRVLLQSPADGSTLLSTGDFDYGHSAGPRVTIGVQTCGPWGAELTYFGLNHWSREHAFFGIDLGEFNNGSTAPINGPINGIVNGNSELLTGNMLLGLIDDLLGPTASADVTVRSRAEIHNVEANAMYRICCSGFYVLGGFRYFGLQDDFRVDVDAEPLTPSALPPSASFGNEVSNNLFGGQIGGLYRRQFGCFGADLSLKAGVYGNCMRQRTFLTINDALVLDGVYRRHDAAFIGELGLNGFYQVSQCVYLRGGYTLLWVDGIARAADPLYVGDDGMSALAKNTAFLHGATAGVEVRW